MTRERCHDCDKDIANERDDARIKPGGGEHLCWRDYNGGVCFGPRVDWRSRAIDLADAVECEARDCGCSERIKARAAKDAP